ncbi:ATP-binding protein [Catellatospora bangladeshensis]|uniref:LuxR family transcriptional regulator n=2 Tax=Catellatospora bangladeshensis TaxID=310355 RepID=A0A8J3JMK2_9ACTN|nr:LuxR family transcriptional regulator [Catellatospora bangladeshensis]GIF85229.1 LuxR family transcriptional regulator [Catellatospora bangladeshensis]
MGSARPALVGRSAELEQLRTAARRAAAGRGRAVVIEGGIGLGKTALLGELAAECAALGMRTLHGTAEEVEQRLPFAALSACARPLQGTDEDLARVTAMLRGEHALAYSMNAAHHELAVTEALLELADRWLSRGPVALLLDDAQWADPSSIVVLHRLARGIEQVPLLLATAARALAQGDALEGLERSLLAGGALRLRLEPLPEAATVALAERQLGAPPGPLLRRLLRRSTGNPMYLETVLTAYLRDGLITVAGGHAELSGGAAADPDAVPEPLVDLTRRQAELVPRAYREVLQTAAVFGSTVDVGQLAQVLDRPVMEISEVLVDALDSGMLADHGGTLRFRQGVVRELLARSVPRAVQTALHQRAGRALSGGPGLSERTGAHLLAGGELGPDGVQWLTAHADALTGRAPDLAVKLLRRAVAETGEGAGGPLYAYLVRALLWDGEPAQAEETARAALGGGAGPDTEPDLRWLLVQACYRQGRLPEAVAETERAVASPCTSPGQAARFRGIAAMCLHLLGRAEEAEAAADRAVAEGEAAGDRAAVAIGCLARALGLIGDDMAGSLALTDRGLAELGHGIQPDLQIDPYVMRGVCLLELDRFAEAEEATAIAVRHNQRTGGMFLTTAHAVRAHLRFLQGRWDDALAEVRSGLDGPDPVGHGARLLAFADLIAVHRGDTPGGEFTGPGPAVEGDRYLVDWARCLAAEAQGDAGQAAALLFPRWERAAGPSARRRMYRVGPDLARVLAAAGDTGRLRALADDLDTLAAAHGTAGLTGCAALCRAAADGTAEPALAAVTAFQEAGWPLYEAYAHEAAALAAAAAGDAAAARERLARALDLYARLDAGWDAARARSRLREAGVRAGVRGPRGRPKHGWEALTDTERVVADLVAQGMSNPDVAAQLYLSRRTVQSHVSSILAKLALTSRVELAVAAAQRSTQG